MHHAYCVPQNSPVQPWNTGKAAYTRVRSNPIDSKHLNAQLKSIAAGGPNEEAGGKLVPHIKFPPSKASKFWRKWMQEAHETVGHTPEKTESAADSAAIRRIKREASSLNRMLQHLDRHDVHSPTKERAMKRRLDRLTRAFDGLAPPAHAQRPHKIRRGTAAENALAALSAAAHQHAVDLAQVHHPCMHGLAGHQRSCGAPWLPNLLVAC